MKNYHRIMLGKQSAHAATCFAGGEEGEPVGQQYATDAGPIDVLAISKDKKRLLVVELKRGRASDVVVGQVLRYMGYIKEQLAEADQTVEGAIIALDDDQRMRWALLSVPSIAFFRYKIDLPPGEGLIQGNRNPGTGRTESACRELR